MSDAGPDTSRLTAAHDPRYPVTLWLPVRQFRQLLPVILDADAPDDLTDRLLGDASRPIAGRIRFRLTETQTRTLVALVALWCDDPAEAPIMAPIRQALAEQFGERQTAD